MNRVYISGPMTGLPELNFPAFFAAADQLRAAGCDAVNPAEINADGGSWQECMRRDIAALTTCDSLVTLPNWELSRGARIEVELARGLGLPVKPLHEFLRMADLWLSKPVVVTAGCPA